VVDDPIWFQRTLVPGQPIGRPPATWQRSSAPPSSSAAFNEERLIESPFRQGRCGLFLASGTPLANYGCTAPNGQFTTSPSRAALSRPSLRWDEPFASASRTGIGATSDLDLFLFAGRRRLNAVLVSNAENIVWRRRVFISQISDQPRPQCVAGLLYLGWVRSIRHPEHQGAGVRTGQSQHLGRSVFNTSTILGHLNGASIRPRRQ
jgi:hypothetical protein